MSSLAMDNSAERDLDNTIEEPGERAPLVLGEHDYGSVTEKICGIAENTEVPKAWKVGFIASGLAMSVLFAMIGYLIITGVGVWGVNAPVGWGFAIVNFVFWVGIGHAGTLISAILFLFRQKWRTSINRFAEAMTIFAVMCAGIFPGIHVGRVWVIYWVFPYPNQMSMWPNFRSPLLWDVFAVSTYATVSMVFWYMGMIPDLASLRDRAKGKIQRIAYGLASVGWRGSQRHWHRYETAYMLLAALAAPLVLSVHSVVSFDFAVSQLPGWHTTIFPPYFVVGAIFSGFAMVLMLLLPVRNWFGLSDFITPKHLDNIAKVILLTGSIVGFAYATELFIAWYSGNHYEMFAFANRAMGPYAWAYWIMVTCNALVPQLLWSKKIRSNLKALFMIAILVNVGMWFERYVIVITSLSRDFLPSSWGSYSPTWVDVLTFVGSFGLFFHLFLLFVRYMPMMAMAEVKAVMHDTGLVPAKPANQDQAEIASQKVEKPAGALLEFTDPDVMMEAAGKVREAGYEKWDAYSPFPVHGLDQKMGIKRTKLPYAVFAGGAIGLLLGTVLQYATNTIDYPYLTSGKPLASIPAWIPVNFELTVLLAAFGAFLGMLAMNGLPRFWHPTFTSKRFSRVTNDRFFIGIRSDDAKFDSEKTVAFLAGLGGTHVELLEGE